MKKHNRLIIFANLFSSSKCGSGLDAYIASQLPMSKDTGLIYASQIK